MAARFCAPASALPSTAWRLSLDSAIDLFLDHVKVERGLARNSVDAYGARPGQVPPLRRRARALDDADAVEPRHLLALPGRRCRAPSWRRARRRATWWRCASSSATCAPSATCERDPTADLELPRIGRPLPVTLTLRRGRGASWRSHASTRARGLRDAAMLETLYATGLRVSELVGLRQLDVNLRRALLVDRGQRARSSAWCRSASGAHDRIREYLASARPSLLGARQSPALFVTHLGPRHDAPGLLEAARAATRAPPASASACRRTSCATRSPPTWSSGAPTCAPCRPCSATPTSERRRSTRTSRASASRAVVKKHHPRA